VGASGRQPVSAARRHSLRVLLCDDSVELRALLRSAIEAGRDVEVVGEVGDGDTGVRLAAERQPDVVVLDLEMPGPSPEALLKALRRAAPSAASRVMTRPPWPARPWATSRCTCRRPRTWPRPVAPCATSGGDALPRSAAAHEGILRT